MSYRELRSKNNSKSIKVQITCNQYFIIYYRFYGDDEGFRLSSYYIGNNQTYIIQIKNTVLVEIDSNLFIYLLYIILPID